VLVALIEGISPVPFVARDPPTNSVAPASSAL
jgi:hypothetical protein